MGLYSRTKARVRGIVGNLVREEVRRAVDEVLPVFAQLVEFRQSPPEARQSFHDHTRAPLENFAVFKGVRDRLAAAGVPVQEVDLDPLDFRRWLEEFAEIRDAYLPNGEVFVEKCLEHYLAFRHLQLAPGDVYVDVAAAASAWAVALRRRGVTSYRLDRRYPPGIRGLDIGADAGDTGLPDGFATALSAQCAFECFQGDADVRFVREAARILAPGGRFAILPLYLDDTYFVSTSPYCDQEKIAVEPEAMKLWRDDAYREPFSRHYSPEAFARRVYAALPEGLRGKVLFVRNLPELIREFPGQRIYCLFIFLGEKSRR